MKKELFRTLGIIALSGGTGLAGAFVYEQYINPPPPPVVYQEDSVARQVATDAMTRNTLTNERVNSLSSATDRAYRNHDARLKKLETAK